MNEVLEGRCHCGAVRFEVRLTRGLDTAQRCNCGYCKMRGAVMLEAHRLTVVKGYDHVHVYTFGTHRLQHFFCGQCGVPTHHQSSLYDTGIAVNAACLGGLSPFDFEVVPVRDGASLNEGDPTIGSPPMIGAVTYRPDHNR